MQIEIKKWGNSLAFRVPKDVAKTLQITEGQKVELEFVKEGVLLKTQRRRSRLKLEDMLSNLGPMKEVGWGESVGAEVW
jgi:antitoxin MazE